MYFSGKMFISYDFIRIEYNFQLITRKIRIAVKNVIEENVLDIKISIR